MSEPHELEEMSAEYLGQMQAHLDEGGQLSHRNGVDLLRALMATRQTKETKVEAATALPENDPIMVAWKKYVATDDYKNSFKWAEHEQHRAGSMWAAFLAGWLSHTAKETSNG